MSGRARLLYLYAPEDAHHGSALEKHLSSLLREGLIESFHEGLVQPGEDSAARLHAEVQQAQIVLLLLSADFLHSKTYQALIDRILTERDRRPLRVVPVPIRAVDWQGSGLKGLQSLPRDG